jgi:hypothetical protein
MRLRQGGVSPVTAIQKRAARFSVQGSRSVLCESDFRGAAVIDNPPMKTIGFEP